MKYEVYLTQDAEQDIFDIYHYIYTNDSHENANNIFDNLKKSCLSLSDLAERGHIPPELRRINVLNYRQIHYKKYRIIYQIIDTKVFVHCVFDGRRDIKDALENRLLR